MDDHKAIDKILDRTFVALEQGDGSKAFEYLDRFWARLAVHIRAEHLHLFPALLKPGSDASIEEIIVGLRADHNFFMVELGSLVKRWRLVRKSIEEASCPDFLSEARERMKYLRERLLSHDEIEEKQLYSLIEFKLSMEDQSSLYSKVRRELSNMPPRFGEAVA
ncbi:MAG: hemerythrin domain-containing protein [Pyrinomonadaceae bacterium]